MRGRKPKPSHLRILDGGAGHRPVNVDEPAPKAPLAHDPPSWLTDRQKEIYLQGMASAPKGLLKDLDESIFVNWVVAYDLFQLFTDDVARYGRWVKMKGQEASTAANPAIAQRNKQAKLMQQFAAEMGFTPSARSRVKIDRDETDKENAFGKLKTWGQED